MDDIDDYFNDDLVLDEQTLAILDREEQKYQSQVQQQHSLPAVTKKLRTGEGWLPGIGSRTREDEFEELPEISITTDGSYGITTPNVATQLLTRQPRAPQLSRQTHTPHSRLPISLPRSTRPVTPVQSRSGSQLAQASSVDRASFAQGNPNGLSDRPHWEKQISELQIQLQALRDENKKVQDALKEATEIRFAKEGEVSILRKNMEKSAQSHAAEIARIKVAREEQDAKHRELERRLKEDAERLKTQFIFKQHELEASLRRPPASVRPAKITKNIPATPVRPPGQLHIWKADQEAETGQKLQDTPVRNYRGPALPNSSPHAGYAGRLSPEKPKKLAFLPGFQNAFVGTPLKSGQKAGKEIKQEGSLEYLSQNTVQEHPLPAVTPRHSISAHGWDTVDNFNIEMNSDGLVSQLDEDGDAIIFDDLNENVTGEMEPIEPYNRKAELSRILMTHTHVGENQTTIQLMISLPFSQSLASAQAQDCTLACQAILTALAHPADDSDYSICANLVTKSLIALLKVLLNVNPCPPMIALFNLLTSLTLSLPTMNKAFLMHEIEENGDPLLLTIICEFTKRLIASASNTAGTILKEVLLFLEILCCDVPDEVVTRLTYLPKQMECLIPLLDTSQPHELIENLSRIVLLLSTYNILRLRLLTPSDDSRLQEGQFRDSALILRLCTYLVESQSDGLCQNDAIHSNLLGCLAQISLTQAETLVKSHIVIPTLVFYVATQSIILWNDDKKFLTTLQANSVIRTINQGLFLLHHLVFGTKPNVQLHQKLQHSPSRNLDNLVHVFIVSFGQLSYSDPPDWTDLEGKAELECLSEAARELLDLVVEGPEGDSVWNAYQMDPEPSSETDEEEREARRIEDDM